MTSATPVTTFNDLGLHPELLSRLTDLGYVKPTTIQQLAIPLVLSGRDVIGGANTGSGKTAAFALPLLQHLQKQNQQSSYTSSGQKTTTQQQGQDASQVSNKTSHRPRQTGNYATTLVLVPTRELATQVADSFKSYAADMHGKIKINAVFGGVSANTQMLALRGGADVLIATPGRLLDLISNNAIKLTQVKTLVLDEADRMLSLGFTDELNAILAMLPSQKQTLLFSATFPEQVTLLTKSLLREPTEIQVQSAESSTLVQRVFTVNKGEKTAALAHLITTHQWRQALIFVNAKKNCEHLAKKLSKRGITAAVFHGDKGQGARARVLDGFKSGDIDVLIATDIAARGLDIEKLPVVINFNLPRSPADYMHRIGRSGRAGEVGLALSLIDYEDYHHFKIIEKKNKLRLEREQIDGFAVDESLIPNTLADNKPMAKPAGTGKRKHKKSDLSATDVWLQNASNDKA